MLGGTPSSHSGQSRPSGGGGDDPRSASAASLAFAHAPRQPPRGVPPRSAAARSQRWAWRSASCSSRRVAGAATPRASRPQDLLNDALRGPHRGPPGRCQAGLPGRAREGRHQPVGLALQPAGSIAQTQGDNVTAEKECRQALETNPSFEAALFNLAILRTQAGAMEEAVSLYRQVLTVTAAGGAAARRAPRRWRRGRGPGGDPVGAGKAEAPTRAVVTGDPARRWDRPPRGRRGRSSWGLGSPGPGISDRYSSAPSEIRWPSVGLERGGRAALAPSSATPLASRSGSLLSSRARAVGPIRRGSPRRPARRRRTPAPRRRAPRRRLPRRRARPPHQRRPPPRPRRRRQGGRRRRAPRRPTRRDPTARPRPRRICRHLAGVSPSARPRRRHRATSAAADGRSSSTIRNRIARPHTTRTRATSLTANPRRSWPGPSRMRSIQNRTNV